MNLFTSIGAQMKVTIISAFLLLSLSISAETINYKGLQLSPESYGSMASLSHCLEDNSAVELRLNSIDKSGTKINYKIIGTRTKKVNELFSFCSLKYAGVKSITDNQITLFSNHFESSASIFIDNEEVPQNTSMSLVAFKSCVEENSTAQIYYVEMNKNKNTFYYDISGKTSIRMEDLIETCSNYAGLNQPSLGMLTIK